MMFSDQGWLILRQKVGRFRGLVSGKSSRGGAVRIQQVSSRMPAALPQLLLITRNLVVW